MCFLVVDRVFVTTNMCILTTSYNKSRRIFPLTRIFYNYKILFDLHQQNVIALYDIPFQDVHN